VLINNLTTSLQYTLCKQRSVDQIVKPHCKLIFSYKLSAIDRGFEPRSDYKDYKISVCCFSAKQAAFRRKSKDCLARNQVNVSEWGNMSTHELLFQ